MSKKKKAKNKEQKILLNALKIILVIIIIALAIASLGLFVNTDEETENRRKIEKEKRRKLEDINSKIDDLAIKVSKIKETERLIVIAARMLVGIFFIAFNLWYMTNYNFFCNFDLEKQLNINEAILLVYSFVGFISYGSLSKFIAKMKSVVATLLRWLNKNTYLELEDLKRERENLLLE